MAFEQKDNSGSLFRNDRKEKETHPDYKGSALIGGVEYWVSAWLKKSQSGTNFMSFSYQPKEQQQPRQEQRQPKQPGPASSSDFEDFNDDIPFASASQDIIGNRLQRRIKRSRV